MRFGFSGGLLLCLLALLEPASAAAVEFGIEGGGGTLLLDRADRTVSIDIEGINGHRCRVRGRLANAQSDRVAAEEGCGFKLRSTAQGGLAVNVDEAARDACHTLCGARAWFEGDYVPLVAACTRAGLARSQQEALEAYHGRRYELAFQLWSQGLAACEKTMTWSAVWRWRNDAAIAAAHAGRRADCQRLSQSVLDAVKGVTLPGETQPFTFAPTDAYIAEPLIAAARHNLAKCSTHTP